MHKIHSMYQKRRKRSYEHKQTLLDIYQDSTTEKVQKKPEMYAGLN